MDIGHSLETAYNEGYTQAKEDAIRIIKIEVEFAKEFNDKSFAGISRIIDIMEKELKV